MSEFSDDEDEDLKRAIALSQQRFDDGVGNANGNGEGSEEEDEDLRRAIALSLAEASAGNAESEPAEVLPSGDGKVIISKMGCSV